MSAFASTATALDELVSGLGATGSVLSWLLVAAAAVLALVSLVPALERWRRRALAATVGLLVVGEALLVWFHWRLYDIAVVADPLSGAVTGNVAVPLWVESEKLFVWALVLGVMALFARRHADELMPWVGTMLAILVAGAVLWGRPFTEPLPQFLGQYRFYLTSALSGDVGNAYGMFQSLEGSRQFYYNTWYMWVHPPLLFLSYGAFAVSFAATVRMVRERRSSLEETAYRWARLGYLPLTFGMLLGFPWAILAWSGESWWWSGKVNMSIMMWLLYTAYLHARLYLRRRGMWRWVAALGLLSFAVLVLTYLATYVVPGAHSYA
jgi:cytochrome c biogenesis factor